MGGRPPLDAPMPISRSNPEPLMSSSTSAEIVGGDNCVRFDRSARESGPSRRTTSRMRWRFSRRVLTAPASGPKYGGVDIGDPPRRYRRSMYVSRWRARRNDPRSHFGNAVDCNYEDGHTPTTSSG